MKELTVTSSSSFIFCCVKWPDMAVIGDRAFIGNLPCKAYQALKTSQEASHLKFRHIKERHRNRSAMVGWTVWLFMVMGFGNGIATSAELVFSNTMGYNDNPVAESNSQGSAFSTHSLWLGEGLGLSDRLQLDVGASVDYQAFEAFPDNHQFTLDLTLSSIERKGRIAPYLFSSATIFRDDLIPSDDRNVFILGTGADMTLAGRLSLIMELSYQYTRYLDNASLMLIPPLERETPNAMAGNAPQQGGSDKILTEIYDARQEDAFILDTHFNLFLTPTWTASMGLNFEYTHSSLELESYWQLTPSVKFFWEPAKRWQLILEGSVAAKTYVNIDKIYSYLTPAPNGAGGMGQNQEKECNDDTLETGQSNPIMSDFPIDDTTLTPSVDIGIHFFPNASFDIFTTFSLEHGDYLLTRDNYTEKVIQCGFSWSF